MSRYILVPVDGHDETRTVELPPGLVPNLLFDELKREVENKNKLLNLLEKMGRKRISETDDGCISIGDDKVSDINLRRAVIDTCNNKFSERYEDFYNILRKCGITF